jgi:hypothetical protein
MLLTLRFSSFGAADMPLPSGFHSSSTDRRTVKYHKNDMFSYRRYTPELEPPGVGLNEKFATHLPERVEKYI